MPKSTYLRFILFKKLQLILLKKLRRVYLSLVNNGECRKKWVVDSMPWPQLHKGFKVFWTLCLNLFPFKWLKPRRSRVIRFSSYFRIKIPLGLWQLHTELAFGLIIWRIYFLNVRKRSELWRVGSYLLHSEIVVSGEKKRVFGKIMFWFKNEKVVHMWNEMSEHNFNFVRILKVKSNFNQARMMWVEVNSLRCEMWTIPQMRTFHFWDIFLKYIKFNHEEKKKKIGKRKWCYSCEPLHSFGRK